MKNLVCLAFSGGLDTSWCVPWLRHNADAQVLTVTVDVGGFSAEERALLAARSRELGADEHVHIDAREMFFHDVVRFLVMGNVLRGHLYPLCVGAERSLQAREVAKVARARGASAVAHGCTAAGNDQVRFEVALRAEAPEIPVLAPIRDVMPTREEEISALRQLGLPLPAGDNAYSINAGLWGVTIGGRETTDTKAGLPESAWVRTRGAFDDPLPPRSVRIGFDQGVPSHLDGEEFSPVDLIERLDRLAAAFGIGRGIHLGDTILGVKGRVAFEAPAAAVLIPAHRELEKLVLTPEQMRTKDTLAAVYGDLVHEGRFLDPAARDIEAFFLSSQARVTGEATVLLRPGSAFVEGVTSPHSLHAASRSVYGEEAHEWTGADARGFTTIRSLPGILHARAQGD